MDLGIRLLAASALAAALATATAAAGEPSPTKAKVDFARDVRPILSDACFACHGFDEKERKAGLRLDTHEGAIAKLKSGDAAVVPGNLEESGLVFRVETDDEEMLMPPKKSGKTLTPAQVDVLKRWIAEGAPWSGHWAFEPVKKAEPPKPAEAARARGPVDSFLLARGAEALADGRAGRPAPPRHA